MPGIREKTAHGEKSYDALVEFCRKAAEANDCEADFYQSNHEGNLVDIIQSAYGKYDGIVINPAAYTHTSVAILAALKAVSIPTGEVHLTDVDSREEFRKISYVRSACVATFAGYGFDSYRMAIEKLARN
ncbi:MAG: 3-dehydroquinate dehydratase [Lachnospiraceae bacterium]|nr:3-dehydroquinate dehydratase [Lachnospiraceae bacterium]